MFSWIVGDGCRNSCVGSDPTTDTVRLTMADIGSEAMEQELQQEEARQRQADIEERQEQLRLQQERQRAEEAERRRQAFERQEREVREREERERREREALAMRQEAERLRIEEQRRRDELEAARQEAQRKEKARLEAQQKARKEEDAARQQLQAWLQKNKYASVNTRKTKMMMARYPLHDAVSQKDAATIRLLIRFGADPTLKNSSGRTPKELAKATKESDSLLAAFNAQGQEIWRLNVGGA